LRIRGIFAAFAAVPAAIHAATPIHLAPSTSWVVDYAADSCRLIRHFGQGDDDTIFALESEAPGALDMILVGKPLWTAKDIAPAKFLPVRSKPIGGRVGESTDKQRPMLLFSAVTLLSDDDLAAEEKRQEERRRHPQIRPPAVSVAEQAAMNAKREAFAASTIAIEIDARRQVILDTGSLGAPIKMFDQCTRDSLRDWGVDPDLDDKIVRPVWAPNPAGWFSSSDYPRDMILNGKDSVVKVRVLVDATGRVTKCTGVSHFKEPEFNKITCDKFTSRAHFEPAELADGTKVPSYYVNKVIFRIER
jgi:hypothetical protein